MFRSLWTPSILIVAHEVTNVGNDRPKSAVMGRQGARCEEITAVADRSYYNGEEVLACEGKPAVQSAGFASGKIQRPSKTSSRGR
jgi:hypothetical protein